LILVVAFIVVIIAFNIGHVGIDDWHTPARSQEYQEQQKKKLSPPNLGRH